jgi:thioredoxin reductase (NADPH)
MTPTVPIIGGGPAGMSCALWLHNYGLHPVIIERAAALGGMAQRNPYPNPWLLGWPDALARDNAAAFAGHIARAGIETWLGGSARTIARGADGFTLDVAFSAKEPPRSLSCPALVIAIGTEFRGQEWLEGVPNARALAERGRVVVGAAAIGEPGAALGAHVAIVGGGDNAFDVAHILLERGITVTVVMRDERPRAQPRLVERVQGRVDLRSGCTVERLDESGGKVVLSLSNGDALAVDSVALLLGYRPNTDEAWIAALALDKNADGYLTVDGNRETSCRGVFAVGDVSNPEHPCVATAIAGGTIAARKIQRRLTETLPS